ncbi:hypothetical protein JCM3770_003759 [Rhodotorula araucariae]
MRGSSGPTHGEPVAADSQSDAEHEGESAAPASPPLQRAVAHEAVHRTRTAGRRESERGAGGTTGTRRRKWLVHVVPPDILPHDPPPAGAVGRAGYGAHARFSSGILMPLQTTLAAQVSLVAREYGLPSVAGMCLYLALPSSNSAPIHQPDTSASPYPFPSPALTLTSASPTGLKPRLTDESWPALWSDYYDEESTIQAIQGAGGLPIAGRIEFDFDPRRARWLEDWCALPPATTESFTSSTPHSPAFSLRPDGPRFTTSLTYVHPVTPAWPETQLSDLDSTDDEMRSLAPEAVSSLSYEAFSDGSEALGAPGTPRMSTPRMSFKSHRPLSLISQGSSAVDPPMPRLPSIASVQSPRFRTTAAEAPALDQEATPTRPTGRPAHVVCSVSGFGDVGASPAAVHTPPIGRPAELSPITLRSSGSTFAFPRPVPRRAPIDPLTPPPALPFPRPRAPLVPETDWTTQLDRLREISETSLLEGVDHPSQFGSVDVSASDALGELLLSIVNEAEPPNPPRYEEDFPSGMYPPHGMYGLKQPLIFPHSMPTSMVIVPRAAVEAHTTRAAAEPITLAPPVMAVPIAVSPAMPTFTSSMTSSYPFFNLYPPVYPHIYPYPPPAGSGPIVIQRPARTKVPSQKVEASFGGSAWPRTPATPEALVDDDPFASSSTPDLPTSPVACEIDDAHDFLVSYFIDGRPLSSITEVSETGHTSGSRPQTCGSRPATPAVMDDIGSATPLGGTFGELQLEESDDAQWATQPVGLPETATAPPYLVYSSPTSSIEPSTCHPSALGAPQSPLPSQTITPASAFPPPSPVIATTHSVPGNDEQHNETTAMAYDEDYTVDLTETLSSTLDYSGTLDAPDAVSPGLQAALLLGNSLQLVPAEYSTAEPDPRLDRDDNRSDDGSQYSEAEGSLASYDGEERDPGDECQTFDHYTPMHADLVLPVLFTFSSSLESRDLLDALALFTVEAQVQSVERRGSFTVALGGGKLAALLAEALLGDERIEWHKWEIFSARETRSDDSLALQRFIGELVSRVPICSGKVHVFKAGEAEIATQEYEEQLVRVFEIDEEGEMPRFDLILLGADDLDVVSGTSSDVPLSPRWVAPLSSPLPASRTTLALTPSVLSSARRLAYLLPTPSSRPALVSLLSATPPGYVQLTSRQPVVVFADEHAAGGVEWERARFWDAEGEAA